MSLGILRGCFAVWYSKSDQARDWGKQGVRPYRTRFLPGCFRGVLKRTPYLPVVINHDLSKQVGLRGEDFELWESRQGLSFTLIVPETGWGDEVVRAYQAGDLNGCSLCYRGVKLERRMNDRFYNIRNRKRDLARVDELSEVTLSIGPGHEPVFESTKATLVLEDGRRLPGPPARSAPLPAQYSSSAAADLAAAVAADRAAVARRAPAAPSNLGRRPVSCIERELEELLDRVELSGQISPGGAANIRALQEMLEQPGRPSGRPRTRADRERLIAAVQRVPELRGV